MNKLFSLLGLARRAGKLSLGHDAVFAAVRGGTAKGVILTSDASERHLKELETASFGGKTLTLEATSEEVGYAIGKKVCILSVNDDGFMNAIEKSL